MDFLQLQKYGTENGIEIGDETVRQLQTYMDLLIEWNEKFNLTAITDPEEIVSKHFCDSIIPLTIFDIRGRVGDVGSGAGFPGLVWKIVRPDLSVVLIEPTGKRCTFLNEVIRTLDLEDIKVKNVRSEDLAKTERESFDTIAARAVANLQVLSELCLPLVKQGGSFIAMKGQNIDAELHNAEHAIEVLGGKTEAVNVSQLAEGDVRNNILIRKVKHTPAQYPRNYGRITKKPL